MAKGTAVFLDTSIMIARFVHSSELKAKINARIAEYDLTVTSVIVRQEFKRRLLKDAKYLLEQLEFRKSFKKVMRHVSELPPQQARKMSICLKTLNTINEGSEDADQTDRARLILKSMLATGLDEFDELVGSVLDSSGCACGKRQIRQKRTGSFDLGPDKCSGEVECPINTWLGENAAAVNAIMGHLSTLSPAEKSQEICKSEDFLNDKAGDAKSKNPCLTVGDLVIAIESQGIPVMYTMNGKESQHFCQALGQEMIIRKPNADHEDIVCNVGDEWERF